MWKFQLSLIFLGLILATSKADHEHDHHDEVHGGQQGGNIDPFQEYYDKCNNGTCVGSPKDCYKSKKCDYMVLILKDTKTDKFNFTLFGPIDQGSGYVAVGISHSGKQMANTSITECLSKNPDNYLIRSSWTYKKGKPELLQGDENGSGWPIGRDKKLYQFNGKLVCSFQHNPVSKIYGHIFDLNKDRLHILLAVGKLEADSTLQYHENGRFISSDYLSLSSSSVKVFFGTPLILSSLIVIAKIL